jgi:uncharacterized protein (TIGR02594 family)
MLTKALELYGTLETPGLQNNPTIMAWAKEVGADSYYSKDSIPWCGLFMAVVAKRAGKDVPHDPLRALSWLDFGTEVDDFLLGDVLVFQRDGGGHVGIAIGHDASAFHVLGGNQSDKVCISRIEKPRLAGIRRPKYIIPPFNLRKILLDAGGQISTNEK